MTHFLKKCIVLFVFSLVLVAGCSNLTKENYEKLRIGMTIKEVTSILGKADECKTSMGTKSCTWQSGSRIVEIQFIFDKAVFLSSKGLQ